MYPLKGTDISLELLNFIESDLDKYLLIEKSSDSVPMYKTPRDFSWLRYVNISLEFNTRVPIYIRHKADNTIIGRLFISLSDPFQKKSNRNRNADISVRMLDAYRNKGFMKHAIQMVLAQLV